MVLRAFGFFRVHVRVADPIREDLNLAAVFSLRPVDQIHRPERRLDFSFFRVLLDHDVSVADSFARRFDRKCRSVPRIVAVDDRVEGQLMLHVVELFVQFVVSDIDPL